ncbi:unnamed protein product, partial [Amoebophrya sp. A120]
GAPLLPPRQVVVGPPPLLRQPAAAAPLRRRDRPRSVYDNRGQKQRRHSSLACSATRTSGSDHAKSRCGM